MTARFALYLAPEADEPLWRFGSDWLGYDARMRKTVPHDHRYGIDPEALHAATAHPRVYGFHMTLKAPFRLASGATPNDLDMAVAELSKRHCEFGPLQLAADCRPAANGMTFLCLQPTERHPALMRLEADAVIDLDRWRTPLDAAEFARRRPDKLPPRELEYLKLYGYPYVLDAYRPHFSLTGPVGDMGPFFTTLTSLLAADAALSSFTCRSLALYEQPDASARFHVRRRFALAQPATTEFSVSE